MAEKLAEAHRKCATLKNELGAFEERDRHQEGLRQGRLPAVVRRDKTQQITVCSSLLVLAFMYFVKADQILANVHLEY